MSKALLVGGTHHGERVEQAYGPYVILPVLEPVPVKLELGDVPPTTSELKTERYVYIKFMAFGTSQSCYVLDDGMPADVHLSEWVRRQVG